MTPKYAIKWGVVWRKIPWKKGTSTENVVHGPTFMAYELRLLWHTNPPFMPYEPFLLGVGGWSLKFWSLLLRLRVSCWSFNQVSHKWATEPYSDNMFSRARNHFKPYSDKAILPFEGLWLPCLLLGWILTQSPPGIVTFTGRLIYYHYWCWRVEGATPVKTGTGKNFPKKYQRFARNYYQYWC